MKTHTNRSREAKGFALIVTVTLLVLLSIIALGFLSLSAVTLRSGTQDQAQAEARANARVALQIAIGELQKYTGADTRVTAPANIVKPSAPPIVGAWKSWEGLNHEPISGSSVNPPPYRPIKPNYDIKDMPASSGNGRFLTWLISSATEGENIATPDALAWTNPAGSSEAPADYVALLGEGTVGKDTPGQQIHVVPKPVNDDTGAIAWWVSPENQKARLAQPYSPRTNDVAGLAEMGQTHTITNPGAFGLPALSDDPEAHKPDASNPKPARKALSRQTMSLLADDNPVKPEKKFHDLTTYSTGLLTNTATGGWRKDLSLLTERWDQIYASYPGGRLPLFRYLPAAGPTSTSNVPKPTVANYEPKQSNFYPWSEYSLILGYKQPATYHAASASWASLQSFATSYKNFSYGSGIVKSSPFVWDRIAKQTAAAITATEFYNYKHKQRLAPQIARFQFLVYAKAYENPLNQNPKRYQVRMMYVPFFTLWNPYNVTLEHTISGTLNAGQGSGKEKNFLGFGWRRSPPGVMAVVNQATYPGGPSTVPNNQYRLLTPGNFQTLDWPNNFANPYDTQLAPNTLKGYTQRWPDLRTYGCWLPEGVLTLKPGEAKVFSPDIVSTAYAFSGVIRLKEGYNPGNILGNEFNGPGNFLATQSVWFLLKTDRVTQPYRDRDPGNGFSLSLGDGSSHFGAGATMPSGIGDEFHNLTSLSNEDQGNAYWPPTEVDEVPYSIAELASGPWIPIFSISFGPRTTIGTGSGTEQNRPTKGVLQNNALAAMVLSDPETEAPKDHPANNPFDFAYHSLSMTSTITPNLSNSNGFIATGYQSGDGLSRLVMVDVPLRPMASLVELQGWNPRGQNPYPPFQMNIIGNSDATPIIPKDSAIPPPPFTINPITNLPLTDETNLQHDDAYCANHLLFDDWFLSTIAPDPSGFGSNNPTSINDVYKKFLKGERALANRAYRPIATDSELSDAEANTRITQIINHHEGWLKSASRFEVEGMFNVNSTSIEAWKALLGRAKSLDQIAMHGADQIVAQDVSDKHVVTRGPVASDIEAGTGAGFGGQFNNASEYTGFRSLSDDQIQDLAEKVVEQVRLRGPFLSLAEFVNRQLSEDDDLALAGALQTALNNLSLDPMAALRDPDNFLSDTTMNPNDPKYKDKLAGIDYEYEKAAQGDSAYGAPGWIRQADVLRPIAPILSARDDTFTIRAYGDARDATGKVTARAWCEAVVSRTRDFVNQADAADSINPPANADNIRYGRRYEIVSFRWLNAHEV